MFLRTVMCGHSAYDWNTMPMLRLSGEQVDPAGGVEHRGVAEGDLALAGRLEPGEAAQRGGLAAPARTEEDEELALLDLEVEVVDGLGRWLAVEVLGQAFDADVGHVSPHLRTMGSRTWRLT